MASSLLDSVVHWRKKLERTTDESVILNTIHKLSKVPVTIDLLQVTGIGKVVRSLAKKSGEVGVKAATVLNNWRVLVSSSQKSAENHSKTIHSKHNTSKSERKERKDGAGDKSHKKSASHDKQSSKVKKSSESDGKQNLTVNDESYRYSNHEFDHTNNVEYNSVHAFNSSSKSISTDDSDHERLSVANSFPGKRKSFELSPSMTDNHLPEAKKLKTEAASSSVLDSSRHKNGVEHQTSHGSHKKKDKNKDKEKKSHSSSTRDGSKTSHNSSSHNHKNSETEKSPSKKLKKNKCSDKKSHSELKKSLKLDSTEAFTSSEVRFEDCLNFNDIVPVKKKKSSKTALDKKEKHKGSSSKKDINGKLRKKESSSHSHDKKTKLKSSPSEYMSPSTPKYHNHDNSLPSLLSDSPSTSLPKINEVDILSTLPQTQPNYRPLPQRNSDGLLTKKKVLSNEEAIKFTSSRKERTNVYSGRKNMISTGVPPLFELCNRILIEHIDVIEYLGGVPFFLLKSVLERCTPTQLFSIEHYNPYLLEDTHALWEIHCKKDFRTQKLQENETWRDLYLRAYEERAEKLRNITANISASMSKSNPVRQVKLAYVNSVVKPPRDVARKQAKHGTALPVNHAVKAGPPSKALPRPTAPAINSASSSKPDHFIPKKPKVAPLMAKTLKSMKQCYRR